MTAVPQQQAVEAASHLDRTQRAGLLARTALALYAERLGGVGPQPFLPGENWLREELILEQRRRLRLPQDDSSDEVLRTIEEALHAEMLEVAEPPDLERAEGRIAGYFSSVRLVERTSFEEPGIWAVAVMADGRRALSGSLDNTLKVWDLASGRLEATLEGHGDAVWAVALAPDGRRALSGSLDNTLKVWDLASGRLEATLEGHRAGVRAVALMPDSKRALSGSLDNTLKVWDLALGHPEATLEGHGAGVSAVAVTPDGRRGLSGSFDNTLKVWDLASGRLEATLEGHGAGVSAVAVTQNGRRALSGSFDNTLKVWDLASGKALTTYEAELPILSCAVTPDGQTVLAGDAGGGIHVLELIG